MDNSTNLVASGDPQPLLAALPTSDREIVVFVNASAIYDLHDHPAGATPDTQFFVVPNHYVLMTGPFTLSDDGSWIEVDVWSWAKAYRGWQGSSRFGSNYFGMITAIA